MHSSIIAVKKSNNFHFDLCLHTHQTKIMHVYAEVKIWILAFCYFLRANYFPQLREDLIWPCLYIFPPSPKQQKHSFSAFRCWDLLCLLKTLIWEERSSHQPKSSLLKLTELRDNFWQLAVEKSGSVGVLYPASFFTQMCDIHLALGEMSAHLSGPPIRLLILLACEIS